jgi:hypothetical protein
MKIRICIIITFVILLFILNTVAHVPIAGGENISLESSIEIREPTKSWAIYDEIHETGEVKYYKFSLIRGQRLRLSIFVVEEGFTPGVVLMGENITSNGVLPSGVELPSDYGFLVFEGLETDDREYEAFTPTSYYFTADVDLNVNETGLYYIAIFDESGIGKVGVAIGFVETFSITEWLMIPIDTINIHIWEGQNIVLILAPLYLTIIIGFGILFWQIKKEYYSKMNIFRLVLMFAAFIYIGSGFIILMQMIIALLVSTANASIIVTFIFVLLPAIFGYLLIKTSIKLNNKSNLNERLKIFLLGIFGLIFWCGIIIAPILVMIISILPAKFIK